MAVIGNKAYKYEGTEINPCKGKKELNLSSDESLLFIQDLTVKFYNCVWNFLICGEHSLIDILLLLEKNLYFIWK